MSKIRKKYSPQEKAKIVLEALRGESTTAQLSAKCLTPIPKSRIICSQLYED